LDADKVRLAETGFEELLRWLQNTGEPQSLESLTYQYITILKTMVLPKEEEKEA
jgi:hypothetical protein